MPIQGFLARIAGKTKQVFGIDVSTGAGDAGKILAANSSGKLDESFLPPGAGVQTVSAPTTDALSAGNFVNFFSDSGTFSCRLADNSNGRQADGFVQDAFAIAATAVVYPLDGVNADLSGLTQGAPYWLGTAGGVIDTPLDETDVANANKVSQYLGIAKSATELVTDDQGYVVL